MKKCIIILVLLAVIFITASCMGNSGNLSDGLNNDTNTFYYILTCEAGEYHVHKIQKWADGTSDALGITTSCCGNRFWTSYNVAVIYKNLPEYLPENVIFCGNPKY